MVQPSLSRKNFVVESICWFWAVDHLKGKSDDVAFVPKFQNRPQHVVGIFWLLIEELAVAQKVGFKRYVKP